MNENNLSSNQSDFILYTSNDGKVKVDVVLAHPEGYGWVVRGEGACHQQASGKHL